jgi:hypothetical protein
VGEAEVCGTRHPSNQKAIVQLELGYLGGWAVDSLD